MKILIFDSKNYDKRTLNNVNSKQEFKLFFRSHRLTLEKTYYAEGCDAVCTFVNCDVNAKVIERLSQMGVKFIFQRSAGYNNIDLTAAKKFNIKVYRVPAYSPESVAEHALTLMLSLNRNIHLAQQRISLQNFSLDGLEGYVIRDKTIGIMGAGKIGQAFIKMAQVLSKNIIVYDEYAQKNFPETAKKLGFTYANKETIFKDSDFLSLHLPLLDSTKEIINKDTIAKMKMNAIIINTSRGGLINTDDLLDALDEGRIKAAGLDVYEKEQGLFFNDLSNKLIIDKTLNRLRAHRNVIITSHQAFFTHEALDTIAKTTYHNFQLAKNCKSDITELLLQEDGKIING